MRRQVWTLCLVSRGQAGGALGQAVTKTRLAILALPAVVVATPCRDALEKLGEKLY